MVKYTKQRRQLAYELGVVRKEYKEKRKKEFEKSPKELQSWLKKRGLY